MLFPASFTVIYSVISSAYCYLFVYFCKLLQVVFKKGNLLFLGDVSTALIRLHPCALSTKTVESLQHKYCPKK